MFSCSLEVPKAVQALSVSCELCVVHDRPNSVKTALQSVNNGQAYGDQFLK